MVWSKGPNRNVREAIPIKKLLTFGHFPKGGEGVQPKSKSFWDVFLGFLLDIFKKKEGGLKLFQKFWGSFEVVLRYFLGCFEVVFGGKFFPKSD